MTQQLTAEDYVRKGAKFLDKREPGWVDKVDLGTLRMSASTRCVLCQVAGGVDWDPALRRFNLSNTDAGDLGFTLLSTSVISFPQLDAAWRELIRERRAGAVSNNAGSHRITVSQAELTHLLEFRRTNARREELTGQIANTQAHLDALKFELAELG